MGQQEEKKRAGAVWGDVRAEWLWVVERWEVADWDDEAGLRNESGSEGWAGITKVIFQADTQQGQQR